MFSRIAPRYDFLNTLLSLGQDQRWRRHLVSSIHSKKNGALLDLATGTGKVVFRAASKHPEFDCLIGMDISEGMLAVANKKNSDERISFHIGSGHNIPLENDSVDCITISFGLRNMENRTKVYTECHRVLKHGGQLIILEFFTSDSLFGTMTSWYNRTVIPFFGKLLSNKAAYSYLPQSIDSFISAEECANEASDLFSLDSQKRFLGGTVGVLSFVRRDIG